MPYATSVLAPWGPIALGTTDAGLVGLEVLADLDAFVGRLAGRLHAPVTMVEAAPAQAPRPTNDDASLAHLDEAVIALRRWLDGDRRAFDHVPVDLGAMSAWDRTVLEAVRTIPWGTTASYGDVARMIGRAGAARAVGGAVGRNPLGLVIPCHRVIAGDGTLGGYGGGWWGERERLLGLKRELLAREGLDVRERVPQAVVHR